MTERYCSAMLPRGLSTTGLVVAALLTAGCSGSAERNPAGAGTPGPAGSGGSLLGAFHEGAGGTAAGSGQTGRGGSDWRSGSAGGPDQDSVGGAGEAATEAAASLELMTEMAGRIIAIVDPVVWTTET